MSLESVLSTVAQYVGEAGFAYATGGGVVVETGAGTVSLDALKLGTQLKLSAQAGNPVARKQVADLTAAAKAGNPDAARGFAVLQLVTLAMGGRGYGVGLSELQRRSLERKAKAKKGGMTKEQLRQRVEKIKAERAARRQQTLQEGRGVDQGVSAEESYSDYGQPYPQTAQRRGPTRTATFQQPYYGPPQQQYMQQPYSAQPYYGPSYYAPQYPYMDPYGGQYAYDEYVYPYEDYMD